MTEPDNVAARGRAIFERLRSQGDDADGPDAPAEETPSQTEDPPTGDAEAGAPAVEEPEVADPVEPKAGESAESHDSAPSAEAAPRAPLPGLQDLPRFDEGLLPTPPATSEPALEESPLDVPDAPVAAVVEDLPPTSATEASLSQLDEELAESGAEASDGSGDAPADVPAPASSFVRDLPRVMAIANQKGGVGKTTTTVNLGACLADLGYRVLVVDLDPQGNASTGLGINIRDLQGSMYDVILHDLPIEDCVEATSVRNLFCAPSSLDLAGAEIELVPAFSREQRLRRALDEVLDDYDFVLIDCPPSLGLLTINGLAAATEVVVPIQCEYYALEGLGQLLRNVNLVQRNLNPRLEVSALILVMYDARTKLADQVVMEVREHFGDKVCRNVVPRTVRLSEAPSFGQPIIAFDPSSRGAIAYRELAKEVSGGAPQRAG